MPESVLFDGENKVLYASNIDGKDPWGKDGKGSIAKIGLDGKIIAVDWVTGLDAPKGLGMYKGKIYAADIDNVVVVDIKKGAIVMRIPIEGAQGLENLKGANGVLMRGKDFFLVDAGGAYKANADKTPTKIADGMEGGTDGIENVSGNDLLVSRWQGALWYVHADGTKELLFDGKSQKTNTADIGFDPKTKIVYVPTFRRNSVIAFQVK